MDRDVIPCRLRALSWFLLGDTFARQHSKQRMKDHVLTIKQPAFLCKPGRVKSAQNWSSIT